VPAVTLVEVRDQVEPVLRFRERPPARAVADRVPAPTGCFLREEAVQLTQIAAIESIDETIDDSARTTRRCVRVRRGFGCERYQRCAELRERDSHS